MKIRDIMTQNVGCCGPHTNAAAIAEILWSRDCGSVPVVDERGFVLGIVTDRDLAIALGTRDRRPSDLQAHEVMTKDLATAHPEDDAQKALTLMQTYRIHRLPIVDESGRLVGMTSIYDIVQAATKPQSGIAMAGVLKAMARLNDRSAPRDVPILATATA